MKLPAALAATLCALATAASAVAGPSEPLGHHGRWITDAQGRVVILHGFNTVPVDEQTLPADIGMGPDNAEWLADNGFNTIRLGLYYARVEPQPGQFDPSYLDDFLRVQQELADKGIFTLVDLHQDQLTRRFGTGGALPSRGFPDWFAIDDGAPNTATGYPQGYITNPALDRAYDNIWADAAAPDGVGLQEHFARGLQLIAAAFRDRKRLLGYDLFNEPWPGSAAASCASPLGCPPGGFDQTLLTQFFTRATRAVRQVDDRHLVFYEPNLLFDYGAQTGVGPVPRAGGFSFHAYCLPAGVVGGGQPSADQCSYEENMSLDNAIAQSKRTGDALLLSEAGFDPAAAKRFMAATDQRMLSWQWWDYYGDHSEFSQPSWPTLIRPYPQVTAGTPRPWSWDESGPTFTYSYSTTAPDGRRFRAGARTEVFIPRLHFPDGYTATARGARVVSDPGASMLVLEQKRGATEVTLRVSG